MLDFYRKAGIVHKLIQQKLGRGLTCDLTSLDIVELIENEIKLLTKYDELMPLKAGIAFPVGININKVAAHFTPSYLDNPLIIDDDLVKIDYGVHFEGCIVDGAISWSPNQKYNELINISQEATNEAIKNSGVDVILGELGEIIEEVIESYTLTIDKKDYDIMSITSLCGHNILPYKIHGGKFVPNGKNEYFERMKSNEIYAIETFPTLGNKITYNVSKCNHFMLEKYDDSVADIYRKFLTLPFCPRWINVPKKNKYIKEFPVIMNNNIVAQYEKSIFITNESVVILN